MARPLKEINWDLVLKKMEAGCKASEIYGNMCDKDTFYRRFELQFGCSYGDYAPRSYSEGHGNVRLTQYMKALKGDPKMLTLLGQEWLGQGQVKDTLKAPNQNDIDKDHIIMELQNKLNKLLEDREIENK